MPNTYKKREDILFFLGFILFYISLFVRDVAGENIITNSSRTIRLVSYVIITLNVIVSKRIHIKRKI